MIIGMCAEFKELDSPIRIGYSEVKVSDLHGGSTTEAWLFQNV